MLKLLPYKSKSYTQCSYKLIVRIWIRWDDLVAVSLSSQETIASASYQRVLARMICQYYPPICKSNMGRESEREEPVHTETCRNLGRNM